MGTTIGERLRALREEKDLSQRAVAARLNCSANMISNYELNKREPDFNTLQKLCDLYGVTADYIIGRDEKLLFYSSAVLTKRQKDALALFNKLPGERQDEIIRLLRFYIADSSGE